MAKTVMNRLNALESQKRYTHNGHEYEAVIPFGEPMGDPQAKYYKDGQEITREQYKREAPPETGLKIVFGDPIPPRVKSEPTGAPQSDL